MDAETWPLSAMGPHSFEGRTAIVTGASSGIGKTAALGLARLGANVVCVARGFDQLEEAVEEIRGEGGEVTAVKADCTVEDDARTMVDTAMSTYGRLDMVFNNAGTEGDGLVIDYDMAKFDEIIGLNVRGTMLCMKYELRAMIEGGRGGSIVNCGSTAGLGGSPGRSVYVASKWGLIGLTKSVAIEYGPQNIRANVVAPGATVTPRWSRRFPDPDHVSFSMDSAPLRRVGQPEEQAATAIFLMSDAAAYITGVVINVDGGSMASGMGPIGMPPMHHDVWAEHETADSGS